MKWTYPLYCRVVWEIVDRPMHFVEWKEVYDVELKRIYKNEFGRRYKDDEISKACQHEKESTVVRSDFSACRSE